MAKDNQDILLDENGNEIIANGDFVIGNGELDDSHIIMRLNTGACKMDPILGPNLVRLMNSTDSPTKIKQRILLHLRRDNKEPQLLEIKNGVINYKI